jgi:Uma2 family endonuclease
MAVSQQRLTLGEFLELPEQEPPLEFEEGMVVPKVSPRGKHSLLQFAFCQLINQFAQPRRMALAFPELRISFSGRSVVPDVSFYRWDRIPIDSDNNVANEFSEPPDLAIEIVSPEQSVNALIERCLWYVVHGVKVALLVDPSNRSIVAFRPGQVPSVGRSSDEIDLADVLPGFQLTVEQLFAAMTIR